MDVVTTGFIGYLIGSIAMGMTCGTGCSPAISLFLSNYVFQAEGDTRRSMLAFLRFFLGKAAAVVLVCLAASYVGSALIDAGGYLGRYQLRYLMPGFLILTGIYMLRKCWLQYRHKGCQSAGCSGHCHAPVAAGSASGETAAGEDRVQRMSPLIGGFLYGLTPCAPLVLLAGYAVTLGAHQALVLGAVFSVSCMVSPLLLVVILMRLVVVRMRSEVPAFFRIARAFMSAAVLVMGIVTCYTGIEPY